MTKKLKSVHPGEILMEEFLKPVELSLNQLRLSLALTSRLRLTPSSAALRARFRWISGGTRTMNFPLNVLPAKGEGGASPDFSMSRRTVFTVF